MMLVWIKRRIGLIAFIAALLLAYADQHYWHSFFSYNHIGKWTKCEPTFPEREDGHVPTVVHYRCAEGEITLEIPVLKALEGM